MGLFSDHIHYDRTSGTKTLTTAQKNTLHNAYRRYAKRMFREAKQRYGNVFKTEDRALEIRFSTGAFVNSDEYQNLATVRKYNIKFTHDQQDKIARKAATLLRKDKFKVEVGNYGLLYIYKK